MFSTILTRGNTSASQSTPQLPTYPSSNPPRPQSTRHATADFTEADDDDDSEIEERVPMGQSTARRRAGSSTGLFAGVQQVENGRRLPVLPLFSASHLDSLPIYNLTHAIRILIQTRTETTLTWDQLRSPQVSQFLLKPMLQAILTNHFSRATLYALMANTLQFAKEATLAAGTASVSRTRSHVCQVLAIKLLKEYNTRELIDALSYDFHPLQGFEGFQTTGRKLDSRTSTLEVAIRAGAKHFLSHPLVVQQLEAIWSGAISFYSAADNLHREKPHPPVFSVPGRGVRTPLLRGSSRAPQVHYSTVNHPAHNESAATNTTNSLDTYKLGRRTVSLYNPRYASPFKLSRLRVPRYRSFLSTISLGVLIGLLLAVLVRRSTQITGLELIFWFWSAGFMLDELVGFNEQGFSLYIMSFWNIFDLGILCMLILYYCMRAYGVFLLDPHHWNDMAYDVLAANAILLLPRVFSVLDHYPYFSQLLIAFRLMAVDLAAVLFLIIITCSGFFVYFTFSKNHQDSGAFAFSMFQIIMGYTPAAWDIWDHSNLLGKSLLVLFLIICHFVVVTILITVLTNSFMAIASNATQEHQFLFAINTISMVKNDSLFSYIPPFNIFAWLLMPLRYIMPLRHFVWLNRLVIKITHVPILWTIFIYERYFLASSIYEPTDLVDHPGVRRGRALSIADPASRIAAFSPNVRVREESVVGFQKDRALEEVFRRPPDHNTIRNQRRTERRRNQTEIRNWMDRNDDTPVWQKSTQDPANNRDWLRRYSIAVGPPHRVEDLRSTASDPADMASNNGLTLQTHFESPRRRNTTGNDRNDGDDGDDEGITTDGISDEDGATEMPMGGFAGIPHFRNAHYSTDEDGTEDDATPTGSRPVMHPASPRTAGSAWRRGHSRGMSNSTVMFNPVGKSLEDRESGLKTPTATRWSPVRRSTAPTSPVARPIHLSKSPGIAGPSRFSSISTTESNAPADPSDISSPELLPLSSSFQTQMAMAFKNRLSTPARPTSPTDHERLSKLVLARMKTLEESFAEVIREMRSLKDLTVATAPVSRVASAVDLPRDVKSASRSRSRERERTGSGSGSGSGMLGRRPGYKTRRLRSPRREERVDGEEDIPEEVLDGDT